MFYERRGVAAIEFVLIAPVIIGLLMSVADIGITAMRYFTADHLLRSISAYALYNPPPNLNDLSTYLVDKLPPNTTVQICGDKLPATGQQCVLPTAAPRSLLFSTVFFVTPIIYDAGCRAGCTVTYLERFQ